MTGIHDAVGVGFGPANLALAIAIEEEASDLDVAFVERQPRSAWQSGMLLPGSDIQNHPVRDLVSLRNPRSRYSFINFLHEHGRLVEHLNLPLEFPLRKEYAQYIEWAAGFFADRVRFGAAVTGLAPAPGPDETPVYEVALSTGETIRSRALVLATGRTPFVPEVFADVASSARVPHLTRYLPAVAALPTPPTDVAVVGGSQSAVELTLDLSRRYPDARITLYVRSFALRQKDTSPFSEEGFFPGFTDTYYRASRRRKARLDTELRPTNYSSTDRDVLVALYATLYEQRLDDDRRVAVLRSREIRAARQDGDAVHLTVCDLDTGAVEHAAHDLVILATGFRDLGPGPDQDPVPPLLEPLREHLVFDDDGYVGVEPDYALTRRGEGLPVTVLNGLCESTHGIGDAGSFSLLSLRAKIILDGLAKRLSS